MPNCNSPLRDVLREVEQFCTDKRTRWGGIAVRLARELRALAPLLRELAKPAEAAANLLGFPGARELMRRARALADELEVT